MKSVLISERESGLQRGLGKTQIVMIGLGGAIGTGLFMGSGLAIGYAGPAVILSYVLAGFVALVMVFSLSEMAVVHPTAGSFGTYAETYLNPWAGLRGALHLLGRAGDRHRRRGGRGGAVHGAVVSRQCRCGCGHSASAWCCSTSTRVR